MVLLKKNLNNYCGVLQIEPTDKCNLKCKMCSPQVSGSNKVHGNLKTGFMKLEVFKKIIDSINNDNLYFDHLILQWLGEPTLNPLWLDMFEYAVLNATHNFEYFRIDTNGILLNEKSSDRIIKLVEKTGKMIIIVFSLDASNEQTYKQIKGVDSFEKVYNNISYLLNIYQYVLFYSFLK